jgi:acyl-CoA dehydrogenase
MDLALTEAELAFRDEVRNFFDENLPEDLRRAQRLTTTVFSEFEISRAWHKILFKRGWVAPSWPKEFGGTGWSIAQKYIFQSESARVSAPSISPIGLAMVGPVVIHFGTPAQKDFFLPRILAGEDYWCQGFSEPGSGSDLASLRLRAVEDGDDYVLNGSKIWTTHAHYANWMIALVRTADTPKPQAGITCLMLRMDTPGVTVRPINTIGGDHEVNQVFFDDVRVPIANRMGAAGEGWSVAKYLLEFERGGGMAAAGLRRGLAELIARASREQDGLVLAADPDVALAIAELGVDIDALEMLELRTMSSLKSGENPGAVASILKLRASQLQQGVSEVALRMVGESALRWEARRPLHEVSSNAAQDELLPVMSRYLNNRANTIFGGSSEIQKGIIAKAMLGL